ncbi:hypothetical protein RHS03_07848, partial [Rhizoctonia solani]
MDLRSIFAAYQRVGQFLMAVLAHEVNAGRGAQIFEPYKSWSAIAAEFRFEFSQYVRQRSPFDGYRNVSSPLAYWKSLSHHHGAQILSYLAIKLFSVLANSMPDERTGSAFSKFNTPDRAKQNAETVISMTKVLQREQRKSESSKAAANLVSRGSRSCEEAETSDIDSASESRTVENAEGDFAVTQATSAENAGQVEDELDGTDVPVEWEHAAGLDETIEPVQPGPRDTFVVALQDGIDITAAKLLNLLSDELVEPSRPLHDASGSLPIPVRGPPIYATIDSF